MQPETAADFTPLYECRATQQTILNVLGSLYTCCLFLGILNAIFVQPVMSDERAVMYRERGAGMYAIIPWYTGLVSQSL